MTDHIEETTEQARQGETKGWVRRVLAISTGLALIAMLGLWLTWV